MTVARTIAQRSLCSRDRVGAVIVDRHNRIVDTGYNGPPRHHLPSRDGAPCREWCARARNATADVTLGAGFSSYDDCDSLHAEQNALMFSDRRHREGGLIYVSSSVCGTCAKLIANSGLAEVIYAPNPSATHREPGRWVEFMEQCGLVVVEYVE
jgi:dCMP deaminase